MWNLRKITNQIIPVLVPSKLDIFIDFYICDSLSVNYPSGYLDCSVVPVYLCYIIQSMVVSECWLEHSVGLYKSISPILRNIKVLGTHSIQMFSGLLLACSPRRWWSSLPPLSHSIFFFPLPIPWVINSFCPSALWPTSSDVYCQLAHSPTIGPGRHRDLELVSALLKTRMSMFCVDGVCNLTDLTSPHILFSVSTCTKKSLGYELFSTYISFHIHVFILGLYFKPVWLHAFVLCFCDVSSPPSL